jgi:hypothetical protein
MRRFVARTAGACSFTLSCMYYLFPTFRSKCSVTVNNVVNWNPTARCATSLQMRILQFISNISSTTPT